MSSNTGQTIVALLTGAALGVGVGILFAPDKGSATRDKIGKEANKAQKKLNKQVKKTSNIIGDQAQYARLSFEEKLTDTLSAASHKADDIIMALEDKLEQLRKQNSKLQKDDVVNQIETAAKKVVS